MKLTYHPLADVFPVLPDAELQRLGQDILANGMNRPIVLFEDQILDGRNRHKAAKLVGYETKPKDFLDFTGDFEAAVRFVMSENLHRRHLTSNERALAAERLSTLSRGRPPVKSSPELVSLGATARAVGTSPASIKRVRQVRDKGVPELLEQVVANEVPVRAAAELSRLPAAEQREVLAAGPVRVREAVAALRQPQRARAATGHAWSALVATVDQARKLLNFIASERVVPSTEDCDRLAAVLKEVRDAADLAEAQAAWLTESNHLTG